MNSPEAERTNLSIEEETKYADIVMREFHGSNPERQYEEDVADKFDSLLNILIAKEYINGTENGTARNHRNLEARIKMYRPDVPVDERDDSEAQKMTVMIHVKPSDRGQEKAIVSLHDNDENIIGLLTMKRDDDGEVIFNPSKQGTYDWYEIFDRTARAVMNTES